MAVSDYNTNPDLNTTISGINIAEGCPPSGINNAIRQLMADVKTESNAQNTALGEVRSSVEAAESAADAAQSAADAAQSAANAANVAKATFKALSQLSTREEVYERRGLELPKAAPAAETN